MCVQRGKIYALADMPAEDEARKPDSTCVSVCSAALAIYRVCGRNNRRVFLNKSGGRDLQDQGPVRLVSEPCQRGPKEKGAFGEK